jgi:hypothetical protein
MWESATPCPPPSTVAGVDPRVPAGWGQKVGTRDHVPSDIQGPFECLDLLALDFKSQMFLAFAQLPSYADWLLDADLTSAYRYELRVLKLLQWGQPTRPWRLKTPMHMLYLPNLDAVFPDARVLFVMRDPRDVCLSCVMQLMVPGPATMHLLRLNDAANSSCRAADVAAAGPTTGSDIDTAPCRPTPSARWSVRWLSEPVTDESSTMQHWGRPTIGAVTVRPRRLRPRPRRHLSSSTGSPFKRWTDHHQATALRSFVTCGENT